MAADLVGSPSWRRASDDVGGGLDAAAGREEFKEKEEGRRKKEEGRRKKRFNKKKMETSSVIEERGEK
jgi:hypothetical protein